MSSTLIRPCQKTLVSQMSYIQPFMPYAPRSARDELLQATRIGSGVVARPSQTPQGRCNQISTRRRADADPRVRRNRAFQPCGGDLDLAAQFDAAQFEHRGVEPIKRDAGPERHVRESERGKSPDAAGQGQVESEFGHSGAPGLGRLPYSAGRLARAFPAGATGREEARLASIQSLCDAAEVELKVAEA